MLKLSDTVERKFVDVIQVDDWMIETEEGWVDVTHFNLTVEYEVYQLTTTNCFVECADDHIVFRETGQEVFVKDLRPGDAIKGQHGTEYVISVVNTGVKEHMADLTVGGNHTFYAHGILHHNTTTVAAYLVWYVIFNDSKTVAILANKAAAAREIMSRFQLMYENLPKWLQQGVVEWNKGSIALENNSKAFTAATSSSGIRGKSVNFLYIDEAAIIQNTVADEFFTATYPTISAGKTTKIALTSTPLGLNHFWKFWKEAEEGINGFVPVRVEYWEHPEHDQKWADEQRQLLGDLKYRQEVLMDFLGSAATLISADAIQRMPIKRPLYSYEGFSLYDPPFKGNLEKNEKPGSYVLVVDTASGVGGDASAFTVIRVDTLPYKTVATFSSNVISPLLYPNMIFKWAKEFNEAFVLIEINKSEQVPHILHYDLEYENIIYVNRTNKGQTVTGGFGGVGRTQLGLIQDKKTKRVGCHMLKDLVEQGKLEVCDSKTISEISTFIEVKDSYAADDGYHDDSVMTLVIFGWLAAQPYFKELTDIDIRTSMYKMRMEAIEQETLPVGFFNDGTSDPSTTEVWVDYNQPF